MLQWRRWVHGCSGHSMGSSKGLEPSWGWNRARGFGQALPVVLGEAPSPVSWPGAPFACW